VTSPSANDIVASNPFEGNRLGFANTPMVDQADVEGSTVRVSFSSNVTHEFHHQWLRHCCYCADCGNPADGIRFCTVIDFDDDIRAASATAVDGDLHLEWPDGHRSVYGADWLLHHAYDGSERDRRAAWRPTLWKQELSDDFPTVSWPDATDLGSGQLRLYETLRDYGIVRISDVGVAAEGTEMLADLLGPIHETTVYGRIYDGFLLLATGHRRLPLPHQHRRRWPEPVCRRVRDRRINPERTARCLPRTHNAFDQPHPAPPR